MPAMANGSSNESTSEAPKAEAPKAPTTEARDAWAVEVQRDAGSKGNLEALVMAIGDSKGLANVAVKLVHVITTVPCGLGGEMAVSRVDKRAVKGHELHVFKTLIRPLVEYAKRKKTSVTYLPVRNDSRDQGIVSAMDLLKAKRVYMPCRKSQLKAFEHLGLLMPGGLLMVAVCAGKRLLEHHVAEVTLVSDGEEGSGCNRNGTGGVVEKERQGQPSSREGGGGGSCRSSSIGMEDVSADLLVDIIGDGCEDDDNNDDARSSVSSASTGRNRSRGSPATQGSHSQPFSVSSRRHHFSGEHRCAPMTSVTSYSSLRELSPTSSHSSTVSPSHSFGHHPHSHHQHPRSFSRGSPTSAPIPLQPHLPTQGCLNPSSGPIPLHPHSSGGPSPVHSGPIPLARRLTSHSHREPSSQDAYASYTYMNPRETSSPSATPSLSPGSEALRLPAGIDRTQSMSAALLPQRAQGSGGAAARAFVSGSHIPLMPSLSEHSYCGRAGAGGSFGGGHSVGDNLDGNSNGSGCGSRGPVCQEQLQFGALTLAPGSSIQADPAVEQSHSYGVALAASDFASPVNKEAAHDHDLSSSFVGAGTPLIPSKVRAPGFLGQRPASPLTASPLSASPVTHAFARPSAYEGSERRGSLAVSTSSGSIPLGNSSSSSSNGNGGNGSDDTLGSQGIVRSLSSASVVLWNRASSLASAADSSSSNISSPASSGLYPSSSDSRLWSGRTDSSEGGMPSPSAYQGKRETAEDLKRELDVHLADSSLPSSSSPSPPTLRSASGGTVTWKLPGSFKGLRSRYLMRGQSDRLRPPLPTSSAASGAATAPPLPAVLEQQAAPLS